MKKLSFKNSIRGTTALLLLLFFVCPRQVTAGQNLGGLTLGEVSPRILTPNGDNLNDKAFFRFDTSLTGIPLETSIFDINGAKVGSLELEALDDTLLSWDGRNSSGEIAPAGIYIYMIALGKHRASGTIVVAR